METSELDSTIWRILEDWSFWEKPIPSSIPREVILPKNLSPKIALMIQGVRRSGKSTLLTQMLARYALDPKNCIFINFEDPRLSDLLTYELLEQIVKLCRARVSSGTKLYFFLDEIQVVEGWERWLHSKLERPKNDIFIVTGSNASLLSGELGSALTGRHIQVELFPFDYQEYAQTRKKASFKSFLMEGGFPGVLEYGEPEQLLQQYFIDIVEKDIRERVHAQSALPLKKLVKMVFESVGSEVSLRRLAGSSGLSVDTVGHYLNAAESAYLLFSCPYFAYSERQQSARPKKYYAIDTALRNSVITQTGRDIGKSFENAVFLKLRKMKKNIYYWRDEGEVDFVIQEGNQVTPYQVSWEGIQPRHEKALERFYARFPQANDPEYITQENSEFFL
jgi:uncharacterized protein